MIAFQISIITTLVVACIGLIFYMVYMYNKIRVKKQDEPIFDNLMMYEPPRFQ